MVIYASVVIYVLEGISLVTYDVWEEEEEEVCL